MRLRNGGYHTHSLLVPIYISYTNNVQPCKCKTFKCNRIPRSIYYTNNAHSYKDAHLWLSLRIDGCSARTHLNLLLATGYLGAGLHLTVIINVRVTLLKWKMLLFLCWCFFLPRGPWWWTNNRGLQIDGIAISQPVLSVMEHLMQVFVWVSTSCNM